ncbi:MAG: hypothetical protein HYT87_04940 [Nitrospirae bacterium]|nr:hypothetical protein [Nitrospirota bacterium]
MNRWFIYGVLGMILSANVVIAGEQVTVQGEVIDSTCYFTHNEKGRGHKKCAQTCLRKGIPAALLTDDQKVLLLLPSHDNESAFDDVKKLAAERVEIKGERIEKGGATAIIVDSVKELKGAAPKVESKESGGEHKH